MVFSHSLFALCIASLLAACTSLETADPARADRLEQEAVRATALDCDCFADRCGSEDIPNWPLLPFPGGTPMCLAMLDPPDEGALNQGLDCLIDEMGRYNHCIEINLGDDPAECESLLGSGLNSCSIVLESGVGYCLERLDSANRAALEGCLYDP